MSRVDDLNRRAILQAEDLILLGNDNKDNDDHAISARQISGTFNSSLEVTESIGALSKGTTFNEGDRLENAIVAMFFSYTGPNLSFGYNGSNTAEAGATIDNTVGTSWTENDAGDVTDIRMQREGSSKTMSNAPSLPSSGDFSFSESVSETLTSSGNVSFSVAVDYDEGPVQNGASNPPGPGTKNGGTTLRWRYRFWHGHNQINNVLDLTAGTPSSSEVRGLPSSALNVGGSISENNVDGSESAEIAIENGRSVTSLDISASGFSNTVDLSSVSTGENTFSDGTLWYRKPDVYLADGSTLKTYNVYQWIPDSAFPSDTNLTWNL